MSTYDALLCYYWHSRVFIVRLCSWSNRALKPALRKDENMKKVNPK